ncbi:hypothetical protein VPH35_087656 [Triticum aestivum]
MPLVGFFALLTEEKGNKNRKESLHQLLSLSLPAASPRPNAPRPAAEPSAPISGEAAPSPLPRPIPDSQGPAAAARDSLEDDLGSGGFPSPSTRLGEGAEGITDDASVHI